MHAINVWWLYCFFLVSDRPLWFISNVSCQFLIVVYQWNNILTFAYMFNYFGNPPSLINPPAFAKLNKFDFVHARYMFSCKIIWYRHEHDTFLISGKFNMLHIGFCITSGYSCQENEIGFHNHTALYHFAAWYQLLSEGNHFLGRAKFHEIHLYMYVCLFSLQ